MKIINDPYLKLFQSPLWFLLFLLITLGVVNISINFNCTTSLKRDVGTYQNGNSCKYSLRLRQPDCQTAVTYGRSLLPYALNETQKFPHALFDPVKAAVGVLTANGKNAISTYASDKSSMEQTILSNVDSLVVNPDYILRSINKIYHRFEQII